MDKKRTDTLSDLRRQRERLRRIGVVALLAGGLMALGSCEELTRRDAAATPSAASPSTLPGVASRRGS
jgi:hypothetical protein